MRNKLLLGSLACGALLLGQAVMARDIQLRNTGDDSEPATSSAPNTPRTMVADNTSNMSTEQRVARLERILNSQGLTDILVRMDNLQTELQNLRGQMELLNHQMDDIKQRQRDLYVDIDRRLLSLERNEPAANAGTGAVGVGSASVAGAMTAAGLSRGGVSGPVDDAAEQQAYEKAFDSLRGLRYDQAVKEFNSFLTKYPKGRYAHIAQYWIGEADYAQRKYKQAIVDYQKLIDNYPTSPKLAEAMLKIGYSQYELKNNKEAQTILNQLIKSYPGTTEAGQAQNLLQKIRLDH